MSTIKEYVYIALMFTCVAAITATIFAIDCVDFIKKKIKESNA